MCRKPNSEHSGDAIHPGLDVQLRARPAGSVVRLARLCSASGASGRHYSNRHRLAGFCANAPRPGRSHGRGIRAGSIRSIARHSHSAKATLVQWACPGYPSPAFYEVTQTSIILGGFSHRSAIANRHQIALLHAEPKTSHRAVTPDLGAQRLAWKDRCREPAGDLNETGGIITANGPQDRMPRDTETSQSVQNRSGKAACFRHRRVGVKRISCRPRGDR